MSTAPTRREVIQSAAVVVAATAVGLAFARPTAAAQPVLRPPGALPEPDFLATCIRCGRCGDACPNRAIATFTPASGKPFSVSPGPGEEGTPVIYARMQACTLCAGCDDTHLRCTAACPTGALQPVARTPEAIQADVHMGVAKVDTDLCYSYTGSSCGVCVRACPFERTALRAGFFERPEIDPDHCVGCGLCERACIRYPQAITVQPRGPGAA